MIILAAETSTLLGSIAIMENGVLLACEESMRQGSHSDKLHTFIEQALTKANKKLSDIDIFATGVGPGSFTGIRISLNTIKTLAYCHQKPVFTINSLESLALAYLNQKITPELLNYPIISMINAYKNMCYVAIYVVENSKLIEVQKPQVVRVQNLNKFLDKKHVVLGDGYSTYAKFFDDELMQKLIRIESASDEPHAITLAQKYFLDSTAITNWNELLPLYLRASEAEENLNGIKFQPLI